MDEAIEYVFNQIVLDGSDGSTVRRLRYFVSAFKETWVPGGDKLAALGAADPSQERELDGNDEFEYIFQQILRDPRVCVRLELESIDKIGTAANLSERNVRIAVIGVRELLIPIAGLQSSAPFYEVILRHRSCGITQMQIAHLFGIEPKASFHLIKRLYQNGLVAKCPSIVDGLYSQLIVAKQFAQFNEEYVSGDDPDDEGTRSSVHLRGVIVTLLTNAMDQKMYIDDLRLKMGYTGPTKEKRCRSFFRALRYLSENHYIKRDVSRNNDGLIELVRPYVSNQKEEEVEEEIVNVGVLADVPIELQIFRLVDSSPNGCTAATICKSLDNLNSRLLENYTKKMVFKEKKPPKDALVLKSVAESRGRERRFRFFSEQSVSQIIQKALSPDTMQSVQNVAPAAAVLAVEARNDELSDTIAPSIVPKRYTVECLMRKELVFEILKQRRIVEVNYEFLRLVRKQWSSLYPHLQGTGVVDKKTLERSIAQLEQDGTVRMITREVSLALGGERIAKLAAALPVTDEEIDLFVADSDQADIGNIKSLFTTEAESIVSEANSEALGFIRQKMLRSQFVHRYLLQLADSKENRIVDIKFILSHIPVGVFFNFVQRKISSEQFLHFIKNAPETFITKLPTPLRNQLIGTSNDRWKLKHALRLCINVLIALGLVVDPLLDNDQHNTITASTPLKKSYHVPRAVQIVDFNMPYSERKLFCEASIDSDDTFFDVWNIIDSSRKASEIFVELDPLNGIHSARSWAPTVKVNDQQRYILDSHIAQSPLRHPELIDNIVQETGLCRFEVELYYIRYEKYVLQTDNTHEPKIVVEKRKKKTYPKKRDSTNFFYHLRNNHEMRPRTVWKQSDDQLLLYASVIVGGQENKFEAWRPIAERLNADNYGILERRYRALIKRHGAKTEISRLHSCWKKHKEECHCSDLETCINHLQDAYELADLLPVEPTPTICHSLAEELQKHKANYAKLLFMYSQSFYNNIDEPPVPTEFNSDFLLEQKIATCERLLKIIALTPDNEMDSELTYKILSQFPDDIIETALSQSECKDSLVKTPRTVMPNRSLMVSDHFAQQFHTTMTKTAIEAAEYIRNCESQFILGDIESGGMMALIDLVVQNAASFAVNIDFDRIQTRHAIKEGTRQFGLQLPVSVDILSVPTPNLSTPSGIDLIRVGNTNIHYLVDPKNDRLLSSFCYKNSKNMYIVPRLWLTIDGNINPHVLRTCLNAVICCVLKFPGISLSNVAKHFKTLFSRTDVVELLEILQLRNALDCTVYDEERFYFCKPLFYCSI